MKQVFRGFWVAMLGVLSQTGAWGQIPHSPDEVEIGIEAVFTPSKGWDDNDRVQVVVYGRLPSGCHTVGETRLSRKDDGTFQVRQFAVKNRVGVCLPEGDTPNHVLVQIPFKTEATLGLLSPGNHRIEFRRPDGDIRSRGFQVDPAETTTVDSRPYANVTQEFSEDLLNEGTSLKVKIRGILPSTCFELDPRVEVKEVEAVFIVMPMLKVRSGICMPVTRPFETEVNLGTPTEGTYLIHIRSQNGNALNQIVRVLRSDLGD